MSTLEPIQTAAAPAAIGPYSQAIKSGQMVFLSGQIPLVPETMEVVEGGIEAQTHQVFKNLIAVCTAAGGSLAHAAKLTIYLTDLGDLPEAYIGQVHTLLDEDGKLINEGTEKFLTDFMAKFARWISANRRA